MALPTPNRGGLKQQLKVGRKALAAESGCTETLLLEWVNRADLMRIRGVGEVERWVAHAKELDAVVSH